MFCGSTSGAWSSRTAHYLPHLIEESLERGLSVRVLVHLTASAVGLASLSPPGRPELSVADTIGISVGGLGVRVAPSVVTLSGAGIVQGVYSPSGEWPVPEHAFVDM